MRYRSLALRATLAALLLSLPTPALAALESRAASDTTKQQAPATAGEKAAHAAPDTTRLHPGDAGHHGTAEDAGHEGAGHGAQPHAPPISASRPGYAEGTGVVGGGIFQVEGGYGLTRSHGESSHSIGQLLVRYGLGSWSELRVGLNSYAVGQDHGHPVAGMEDAYVGIKARLFEGSGERPTAALVFGTSLPTGAHSVGAAAVQPRSTLALGWKLGERLGLTTTVHHAFLAEKHRVNEFAGAAALGMELTHHLHAHAEYSASARAGHLDDPHHHVSGGFGYHLSNDLQLDLWTGIAWHGHQREALFGIGFARRW